MATFRTMAGTIAIVAACSAVMADPVLQMDINGLGIQSRDAAGAAVPFGGTTHTGSIDLFYVPPFTTLQAVSIQSGGGPFVNQGFNGQLTSVAGTINVLNGLVTGGSMLVQVNGNTATPDTYTTQVVPNSGSIQNYVAGGFTVQGLTFQGTFSDGLFGNVNVAQFLGSLTGSFLQFNFAPNGNGGGFADIDLFVVAPAPGSLGLLAGAGLLAARRRRR